MQRFPFHKSWAQILVRFGIVPAILAGAFALVTCAQEAPKYRVEPFWPQELPNNWIMGQVGGLAVRRRHAGGQLMCARSCGDPFSRPPVEQLSKPPPKSRSRLLVCTTTIRRSLESWLPNCSSSR